MVAPNLLNNLIDPTRTAIAGLSATDINQVSIGSAETEVFLYLSIYFYFFFSLLTLVRSFQA